MTKTSSNTFGAHRLIPSSINHNRLEMALFRSYHERKPEGPRQKDLHFTCRKHGKLISNRNEGCCDGPVPTKASNHEIQVKSLHLGRSREIVSNNRIFGGSSHKVNDAERWWDQGSAVHIQLALGVG